MINIHGQLFSKQKKFSLNYFNNWWSLRIIGFMFQDSTIIPFKDYEKLEENKLYVLAKTNKNPNEVITLKNLIKHNEKHYTFDSELMNKLTLSVNIINTTDNANDLNNLLIIDVFDDCDNKINKNFLSIDNNTNTLYYTFDYAYIKTIIITCNIAINTNNLQTYIV